MELTDSLLYFSFDSFNSLKSDYILYSKHLNIMSFVWLLVCSCLLIKRKDRQLSCILKQGI